MTAHETGPQRTPRLVRWLLVVCPLGERRAEVEDDVTDLFLQRRRTHGTRHATWRLLRDVLSLATSRRAGGYWLDLQHGLRLFGKHPAVIGAAVGGLALAIAVGTTIFTILNATALRPYGMADPASVVRVQMRLTDGLANNWPYRAYVTLRDRATRARVEASMTRDTRVSLHAGDPAAASEAVLVVSGTYLPTLGARAALGRTLQPADDVPGAPPVAVLHHHFWRSRLGSDPQVVGRTVWLSGTPATVVGVLDATFTGPRDGPPALWLPFASYGQIYRDQPVDATSALQVDIVARVAREATRDAAAQELSAIVASLPDVGIRVEAVGFVPATGVQLDGAASPIDGPDAPAMLMVIAAILILVGLVMALACVNVANLLLAGAAARTREIAIRLALGASRGRILRQFLAESVAIGAVAGAAGLLLSLWLVPLVARAIDLPANVDVRLDLRVLLFSALLALVSGIGAGLAPARHGSRSDVVSLLKSQSAPAHGSAAPSRLRRWFIGFQAASSILLLITAALFLRAAWHLTRVDLGFEPARLAVVAPAFPQALDDAAAVAAYWQLAAARVRALPSVERTSLALSPPFGGMVSVTQLDRGGVTYEVFENRTDADYFATAGFRIVRGRGYTADEVRADAPVAVVSESVARDLLGDADPVGASLGAVREALSRVTIIGVAADAITARVRGRNDGAVYRPLPPGALREARLMVRSAQPAALLHDLEQVMLAVDPRVRSSVTIVSHDVDRYMNEPRVLAGLSGAVAALALLLAVMGVYGVTTFVVHQRMWEVHVRQAIGATSRDIVRLLVAQSLTPVVIGLGVGVAVALAAVRVLAPALSGLSPYDPAALASAVLVVVVTALLAVVSPALRAARADPAAVLRQS